MLSALVLAVYWWSWNGVEIDPIDVVEGIPHIIDFLGRTIPPDTSVALQAAEAMIETVQMSILGTTMGAVLALPLAFAAARNLAPVWSIALARTILNLTRTIPSILWAVVFVAAATPSAASRMRVRRPRSTVRTRPPSLKSVKARAA